jgi:hypothetical protein
MTIAAATAMTGAAVIATTGGLGAATMIGAPVATMASLAAEPTGHQGLHTGAVPLLVVVSFRYPAGA